MTPNRTFRWGILGPGKIAHKFAQSLPFTRNGVLTAVASTDPERGKNFAESYEAAHVYSSYEELVTSGSVDAVYVATPHSMHCDNTLLCLRHGVPVLCEKPMSDRLEDTVSMIDLAKTKNVFLLEGMWTVFLPHIRQARKWIADGKIGELVHIQADFGYKADYNPTNRLFNPALGGSVTKDVGIYPLSLFYKLTGTPLTLQTLGRRAVTGVDDHVVFQGISAKQTTFQGMVSFLAESDVEATILGTNGKIKINSQWLRPVGAKLITPDEDLYFEEKVPGFGFQYEADEVENCLLQQRIESEIWSHQDSLTVAKMIEQVEKV